MRKKRNHHTVLGACVATAIALAGVLTGPGLGAAAAPLPPELSAADEIELPIADVLDVDFADGTPTDHAQGLAVATLGSPTIGTDSALDRNVATFDGIEDAFSYSLDDEWTKLGTSFSMECTFRVTGSVPVAAESNACSNKEAGGASINVNGSQIVFTAHIGGTYRFATTQIDGNQWHHVVGTWDGSTIRLYVNGEVVATTAATGAVGVPIAGARNWVLGGDSGPGGVGQFFGAIKMVNSRIYTQTLTASEVEALHVDAIGDAPSGAVTLTSSTPAAGAHLSSPVMFDLDVVNEGNATGWSYMLDGQAILPGQPIGAGMQAGEHLIVITATDVFGIGINWQIPFTSDSIPSGGGTDTGQGAGTVTISAIATSPDGSDVITTFREATATAADGGFAGTVAAMPTTLVFDHDDAAEVDGVQKPDDGQTSVSPTSANLPFQRFDVPVPATADQRVIWSGVVDPARSVSLYAWHPTAAAWVELAAARGVTGASTAIDVPLEAGYVNDGVAHLMVVGTDPFADDLSPRDASAAADKDGFEDPADYDFSFVHFTDHQYVSEGGAGNTYNNWDGVDQPSDHMTAQEQALWAQAYEASVEWIADNAASRKIVYTAHTGDLIDNNQNDPLELDEEGNEIRPGLDAGVTREFGFASQMQAVLDDAGVVNQVVAGNHDNLNGNEVGPDSRFNDWFGPDRYYAASSLWPAGASYHAGDESDELAQDGLDNQNNYVLFSAGGLDFVAVGLSYGVTQAEADWARTVFERYPDRNGILMTHAYLATSSSPDGRGAVLSGDGSRLFDEVVRRSPNVFLVLAGHEHGVGINLKTAVAGPLHNVVELLSDYQAYSTTAGEIWPDLVDGAGAIDLDGDGVADRQAGDVLQLGASFLRLLQFDVERGEMSIDTYSPMFDEFGATAYDPRHLYNGAEDNLVLPVGLSSRTTTFETDGLSVVTPTATVIAEVRARSGWPASAQWSGLTQGEVYAWVADSRPATDTGGGSISQFGSVFLATALGTDRTPPVLTVPLRSEVAVGDPFDPMAGVEAVDDTDGNVNDRIQVFGSVDTSVPGAYALTYIAYDSNGNQAVASRAVVVVGSSIVRTPAAVSAVDTTAVVGQHVRLSASVNPSSATGDVQFVLGRDVLCEAPVTDGTASCEAGIRVGAGEHIVEIRYSGDEEYGAAVGSFALEVRELSADYSVVQEADPASGSTVTRGDVITYSVTVSQGSETDAPAELAVDLSAVLDDAAWRGVLTADRGDARFDPDQRSLTWSGELAPGEVASLSYSVVVTGRGDQELRSVVSSPGCADACTTTHRAEALGSGDEPGQASVTPNPATAIPPLPDTGVDLAMLLGLVTLLLGAGVWMVSARRRRSA